ncbi:hypothetical protein [Rhodococcus erythropolis]|uniref:hypothetical protein n=1 Tax=Rhodococcus erythropolis TaxID=1833 RepID=UPI0014131A77|nr:hypothetical protein [Rhodococcus erythropolis]
MTAPVEGFTGKSAYGPVVLDFVAGVAEVEGLPGPVAVYLLSCGYDVVDVKPKRASVKAKAETADAVGGLSE